MTSTVRPIAIFTLSAVCLSGPASAQHSAMPAGMTHEQHMEQMKEDEALKDHGKQAMGFDQDTTTHHFTLERDGGAIAVDVNVPSDTVGIEQIRAHLKEIAVAFKQGDFGKPLMTHGEEPPGVPTLQRLRAKMTYGYTETSRGGIVRITTSDAEALAALHAFLQYQIAEHKTGDPITRRNGPAAPMHTDTLGSAMTEIHALFMNHERMTRTVTNLANGVRTVTESSDPRVAQLLKDHVASSRQRVEAGVDPRLPIESDALRTIYANYKKIHTTVETTASGVIVEQTSDDTATVAALQQHASEVTTFVDEGMEAMHKAMMKEGGMHGGMQPGTPR